MREETQIAQIAQGQSGEGVTRRQFLAKGAAFSLAAAVTGSGLTILSGCGGGNGGSSSSKPLTFWQFYAPGGQVKPQAKWFEDTVKAWNKDHKTKVKLQYVPTDQYIGQSKVQTAFQAGNSPDIFLNSNSRFLRYYNPGLLQDLTPFMEKEAINDYYSNVIFPRTVDGKIYALPMEVEPLAMFYSEKAFEKAGLSESDVPKTWDQLLEVASKVQTKNMFGVEFPVENSPYQNFNWYPYMWMGGGDLVSKSGKKSAFDSQGTIKALQFWQDAIKKDVAPRKTLGSGGGDAVSNLGSGYCAMQETGPYGVAALDANKPDFKYGVSRLPVPPNGEYTTNIGGWSFVVNAKGKNPEEAAKFCVWAIGSMNKDSIQRVVDWCTKSKKDLLPRKSATKQATKDGFFESGVMKTFRDEIFPAGRSEPRVPPEIFEPVTNAIQACMLNGADPKQQAKQTAQQLDSFLKGYSGAKIV